MPRYERTFAMIKPMGVHRGLVGAIIQRFENKGFKLIALKLLWQSEDHFRTHYKDLEAEPFFEPMVKYVSSGPVVAMVWEGANAVKSSRAMIGADESGVPAPGTIRGDYSSQRSHGSVIHASDSPSAAAREIELWFPDCDITADSAPTHSGFLDSFF